MYAVSKKSQLNTNRSGSSSQLRDPMHQQRIIKVHEQMLIKITKNLHLTMPETYKFYSTKRMRK